MRDDRRDLGGADKLAQTAPQERWPAGTYQPDLGGCIPESGDVCEGWKTDSIDGLMKTHELWFDANSYELIRDFS